MSDIVINNSDSDSSLDSDNVVVLKVYEQTINMDTMTEGVVNKILKQPERDYIDSLTALNTTATSLPTAINEVHGELDAYIVSNDSALSNHALDISTHGVTEIVGATETQTITNKTFNDITNFIHADATHLKVRATEGILKGQPVVVTGYNLGEDALDVALANNATGVATGVSEEDMLTGEFGTMILSGVLHDVDTSAWNEGDILYLNGSGSLTSTEPTSGYSQPLAYVLRSNANNGHLQINATYPKQDSTDIRFTASGDIASTTVQGAIEEVRNDTDTKLGLKLDKTGGIISSDLEVQGNFTVSGTSTTVNSTTVTTADNLIVINDGEVGTGVTNGEAGIQIDRGLATNYEFKFDETDDSFKIGEVGTLQKVATREDTPTDTGIAVWDNASSRFNTTLTPSITSLSVSGTVDGRDVSADGAKLDGIESGATADQTATEIKTLYESNADTNEYSDAEQTTLNKITNTAVTSITFNSDGTMTVVIP